MRTLINDTYVTVELFNYEQHTDDKYCDTSPLTGELIKPFALANIKLVSDERIEPTIDTLVCRVSIRLIDNLYPKMVFTVADKTEHLDNDEDMGGFTDDYIEELLEDLSQAIQYNEL
jgi:hypothetical protein